MRAISPPRPSPAIAATAERLYRACHLAPPIALVARDTVTFARLLRAAARARSLYLVLMLTLFSILPVAGAVSLAFGDGKAALGMYLGMTLPFCVWLLLFGCSGSMDRRMPWRARTELAAGSAVAVGVPLLIGLGTGSLLAAAVAFAALVGLMGLLIAFTEANGGLPGRLGLLRQAAGRDLPLLGARPVNAIVARRLEDAMADRRAEVGRIVAADGEADEGAWRRLEELGRRELAWGFHDHAPILGRLVPRFRRRAVLEAATLADPPLALRAALELDRLCDAAVLLERVVVVLPQGSAELPAPGPGRRWWRPSRPPYALVLALLQAGPVWHVLVAFSSSDAAADRVLARLIVDDPDPALRLEAIELLGCARFFEALGAAPVDRSAEGALFVVGPAAAPTAVVRVEDAVPGPNGGPLLHWIPVPPHVATAREAVAWTFRKSEQTYAPEIQT